VITQAHVVTLFYVVPWVHYELEEDIIFAVMAGYVRIINKTEHHSVIELDIVCCLSEAEIIKSLLIKFEIYSFLIE
jgi:hypothetical protein